jgi:hypothetical protein
MTRTNTHKTNEHTNIHKWHAKQANYTRSIFTFPTTKPQWRYAKARIKYDNKNVHTGGVDRVSMTKTVTKTIIITIVTIMAGL